MKNRPQQEGLLTRCGYRLDWNIDPVSNTLRWIEIQGMSSSTSFNVEVILGSQSISYCAGLSNVCMRFIVGSQLPKTM